VTLHWTLPHDVASPREARRLLRHACRHLPADLLDTVLLLTDELVTNAVRHTSGVVDVVVVDQPDLVQVEVHDGSPESPTLQAPDWTAESGRGLWLVDQMAIRWGVSTAATRRRGKSVWFQLAKP
jgi:anti-sigma regulatory factor (Ser/Thr protein kinase)